MSATRDLTSAPVSANTLDLISERLSSSVVRQLSDGQMCDFCPSLADLATGRALYCYPCWGWVELACAVYGGRRFRRRTSRWRSIGS
jgi:hypothetical protein